MTLSWPASSRKIDIMATDMAPKTPISSQPRSFHADISADIRVLPGASASQQDASSSQLLLTAQGSSSPQNADAQKRAADMQIWWDEAIAKNMELSDGYERVAVLLIKWDDELDELGTREEVRNPEDKPCNLEIILTSCVGRGTQRRLP